jgi:serine/threonine protein kinase
LTHSRWCPISPGFELKGRYVIQSELGRGGFGVVYLAHDLRLHSRPVVIKVLLDERAADGWFHRKFAQEIEALARIDHPGVVGVLDAGESPDGPPFVVLQFVNGVTLRSVLRNGPMGFPDVASIVRQIGHALTAAHECGVWHRDLKPENIMLQDLGHGERLVKIIDFGIASVKEARHPQADSTVADSTRVAGSFPYMAPEQLTGKPAASSDIYALGVIACEMLTGRRPFRADSAVQLFVLQQKGLDFRLDQSRAGLAPSAHEAVRRALSFDAKDRHARARDFGDELSTALAGPMAQPSFVNTVTIQNDSPVLPSKPHATVRIANGELNVGRLVAKMCNRRAQEDAFSHFFLSNMEQCPGVPQCFLIHGEEGACHESLVQRLMYRVEGFARARYGEHKATVSLKKIPWQYEGTFEERSSRLLSFLFETCAPMQQFSLLDLSAAALAGMLSSSLHSFLVIQHDIRTARWDKVTKELLAGYLAFWRKLPAEASLPQVLVFLNVIYPPAEAQPGHRAWMQPGLMIRRLKTRRIQGELLSLTPQDFPFLALHELGPITRDDVMEWFSLHNIYDSEDRRMKRAQEIFQNAGVTFTRRTMAEIEAVLGNIHREFIAERGYV